MKTILLILLSLMMLNNPVKACNSCGGGTGDLAVLSLDGLALFNIGFSRDQLTGVWNKNGNWLENKYSQSQYKVILNSAYRLNRHVQFAFSLPFVYNTSNIPGLKQKGSGIGDLTLGGRIEIFHEFQPYKNGKKLSLNKTLPYLAITFGINLPTGSSEETAGNDVDITGKGFYSTTLGISITKSIIRSKLQILADLSWQHSFEKRYNEYFGTPINYEYRKQAGEKLNYAVTLNYIINSRHAVSLSAGGFSQGSYKLNGASVGNTNERSTSFTAAYTFYPSIPFRITSSIKTGLPGKDMGKNAPGSTAYNINFTYYLPAIK